MKLPAVVASDLSTSGQIWRTIVEVSQESSRNGKLQILKEQFKKGNTLFTFVLKTVFDNTVNFGIVIKPDEWMGKAKADGSMFDSSTMRFLFDLIGGEYTRAEASAAFSKQAERLNYDSLRLLVAIINKNIGAGINVSTVNKIWKGLIPTFPYMRCSLPTNVDIELLDWKTGVFAQEKADGMFANINVGFDGLTLLSRQGTLIPTDKLGTEISLAWEVLPKGYQVHGEMLCRDPDGRVAPREIGNGIFNSVCKGGSVPKGWSVLFRVWDAIPLDVVEPKGRYTRPYAYRFEFLSNYIKKQSFKIHQERGVTVDIVETIQTKIVHSKREAYAFYHLMIGCGKEGAVLKNPTAIWRDGVSKEQIKLKLNLDCDLKVVGFQEGEGKYQGMLGSVVCESSDHELQTNVSGFSDALRRKIWENKEDYIDSIITVKFNDIMRKDGEKASLFLPRFVEFRKDKIEADSLSRIIEIKNNALA